MSSKVQAILERRRIAYSRELPEKLRQLFKALHMARASTSADAAWLDAARLQAHRLRGTAGSFGFDRVGQAAASIEQAIIELGDADPGQEGKLWSRIDAAFALALDAAAQAESKDSYNEEPEPPVLNASATLLVVDDDPVFLDYVEALGRRELVQVVRATTAEEAVSRARETTIDAALVDVYLTETTTSFNLAPQLKAQAGLSQLPIAFVSANGRFDNRIAAAHAGGSLYLSKPLSPQSFQEALRQLLGSGTNEVPRVLLVDDDLDFTASLGLVLQQEGLVVHTLRDATKLLESLAETRPDLLIVEMNMTSVGGLDVCRMVRATPTWQGLPVIVLSNQEGGDAYRLAVFEAGGDDYLRKPVPVEELLARVRQRLSRAQLLKERADKDPLTGLLSRRALAERLASRFSEAQRRQCPLSICMVDVDRFKVINDRHGHLAGDQVLAALGRLMAAPLRAEDLRGRWGGEEFVLAFFGEHPTSAKRIIERLRNEFRSMRFAGERGATFQATISCGVAGFPRDGSSMEEVLQVADRRLYIAKRAGRDCVVMSDDPANDPV
jgi:diguanylate cyclase (GGDEF)-like protein